MAEGGDDGQPNKANPFSFKNFVKMNDTPNGTGDSDNEKDDGGDVFDLPEVGAGPRKDKEADALPDAASGSGDGEFDVSLSGTVDNINTQQVNTKNNDSTHSLCLNGSLVLP